MSTRFRALHLAAHWFGAQQFDHGQRAPAAVARELAFSEGRPLSARELTQSHFVVRAGGGGWALAADGTADALPDAELRRFERSSSMEVQVGRVNRQGTRERLEAAAAAAAVAVGSDVEGPEEERLRWQHLPIFTCIQMVVVVFLWVVGIAMDSPGDWATPLAGLESIWPWQTLMCSTRNCHDLRPEVWRWFSYQLSHAGCVHL